jgi:hypothetical protein
MMPFLVRDASVDELRTACVENHLDWLRRLADASDGEVHTTRRLEWALTMDRMMPEVTVAVRDRPDATMRDEIDAVVEYCRDNDIEVLSFWTPDGRHAAELGPLLEARGLRQGEEPQWMAIDLHALPPLPPADVPVEGQATSVPERFDDWTVPELMCYGPETRQVRAAMQARRPQRVWHMVIWEDGAPVGQLSIGATEGDLGVLAVHNLVVLPTARVRGLGLDRFVWLQRFAMDLGCRYVVANAFERVAVWYRMLGFTDLGSGRTWWTGAKALQERPARSRVLLAEAIGAGDLRRVQQLAAAWDREQLDQPLANGMTPLRFAGQNGRPDVARWLLARGATPDVIAVWDLGWVEQARQLLRDEPELLRARSRWSGKTLLHVAAQRDDPDLAELLLAAGADPLARDRRFETTPLDWALKMGHGRVAARLRAHEATPR